MDPKEWIAIEHGQLTAEAAALQRMLEAGPTQVDRLFESLSSFASLLAEHLVNEHEVLVSALKKRPSEALPSITELEEELRTLVLDWNACLSSWDQERARREWPAFSAELGELIRLIQARVAQEVELLR